MGNKQGQVAGSHLQTFMKTVHSTVALTSRPTAADPYCTSDTRPTQAGAETAFG